MGIVISTHLPPPVMIDSTEVLKWVPDDLPGILRHQGFELAFRSLVVEKGAPGVAEEATHAPVQ